MTGRHEAPPVGSAAREATAPPWHGTRRAEAIDWAEPAPDRCPSCGHPYQPGQQHCCGIQRHYDDHEGLGPDAH